MSPLNQTNNDAKTLSGLLTARPLQRLIRGAKQQQVLEQLLREVIPDNMFKHITSWQLADQQITLSVSSASWATRIRAYQNDLLYAADRHRRLGKLLAVKITIQNTPNKKKPTSQRQHTPAKKPSNQAVSLVKATADSCEHEQLKNALGSLVKKMQGYQDPK